MAGWPIIYDQEIGVGLTLPDVRASVNAGLMSKYRERQRRLGEVFEIPTDFSVPWVDDNVDWTTLHSIILLQPCHHRGDLGSLLSMEVHCMLTQEFASLGIYRITAQYRLQVVGYETVYSNVQALSLQQHEPGTVSEYFRLDASGFWMHPHASGPTEVTVNFQTKIESNVPDSAIDPTSRMEAYQSRGSVHYVNPLPQ